MTPFYLSFNVSPFRLSGVVYAALLNHALQLAALGDAVNQPPYKAPPKAPVLAVKPRHTLARHGDAVVVPAGHTALVVGASLGLVMGRTACRVPAASALDFVAGYTVANELSLPLSSHYRPSVRLMARDGFCPIGTDDNDGTGGLHVTPAVRVRAPDALPVTVHIDGGLAWQGSTGGRVRGVAQLIADVTEFMTLQPGDVLLLGVAAEAPLARAGQDVRITIEGIGTLSNRLIAEAP